MGGRCCISDQGFNVKLIRAKYTTVKKLQQFKLEKFAQNRRIRKSALNMSIICIKLVL